MSRFVGTWRAMFTLVCAMGLTLLTSCVNEELDPCPASGNNSYQVLPECYMQLNINFPTTAASTRGSTNSSGNTSTDGTDPGASVENALNSINLYFFEDTGNSKNNKLLCVFESSAGTTAETGIEINAGDTEQNGKNYTLTHKVSIQHLKSILGKNLFIYALANLGNDFPTVTEGTTTEEIFLENKISAANYVAAFTTGLGSNKSYGKACPMANEAKFPADFTGCNTLGQNASDGEVITEAEKIFTGAYGTNGDKKYSFTTTLNIERMIARVDFKDTGNEVQGNPYVHILPGATTTALGCNSSDGVYLKLNKLTLKNISNEAYQFRHSAPGNDDGVTGNVVPFGDEKGTGNGYTWVADTDWGGTKGFLTGTTPEIKPEDLDDWLDSNDDYLKEYTAGFSPWYYVMENTVSSTNDMNLNNCTYIDFEFVLCKKDGNNYSAYTSDSNEQLRITMTSTSEYKELEYDNNSKTYKLTYHYLIPHNTQPSNSVVDGETGKVENLNPMHYGIVRNCIYQIALKGVTKLPDPHEPDNFYLLVDLKVLAWAKHDISVTW